MTTVGRPAGDAFALPEERVEGRDKVTGAARYTADVHWPGTLWAAFARSPLPHARVARVDVTRARELPGVRAIVTGADVRPARLGRRLQDWPVLAWDRVRFVGDRVAAVAADTLAQAEAAAAAVEVDYEDLPLLLDPQGALAADAPVLHPDRDEHHYFGGVRPPVPHPNVQGHRVHEHGDVVAAFAGAARVFEHAFDLPRTHPAALEPHGALVRVDGDVVHVVTTNKAPFALRTQLAASLGIPEERIVVDAGHIGGDFGGKGLSIDEFALVFLARAAGRPVKAVTRYADELQATSCRHAARITVRTAVDGDGRFLAHEARVLLDGGAYAAGKPVAAVLPGDALFTLAGYRVPAARVEAMTVYTNTVPAGHARAPGQPQNSFAVESHLDLIALEMGIDPLELRLRNALRPGDVDVLGERCAASQAVPVIETLRREARWDAPRTSGRGRGHGMAVGVRHVGRGTASMTLRLAADGSVEAVTAVPDQGGGAHTMIQRVIAAELGVPLERVRIARQTTAGAPHDPGVGGSRVTPVHGSAALDAARRLRALAVELSGRDAPFAELAAALAGRDVTVTGEHTGKGEDHGVCAYAVDVEVDEATGQIRILDVTLVADVGTVINPVALRGQLEGGFVFGLGQALMEELRVEDGRVVEPNLHAYKLPTIADVPPLRVVLVGDGGGPGPFGAKSVGELSNSAVGPAIANAVADATGARVMTMPMTAEKVLWAMRRA